MNRAEFMRKCFPHGDANWRSKYPKDRILPLVGIISDELMRHPDMFDSNNEQCLLVIKNGNANETTLGLANGIFSITQEYPRACITSESSDYTVNTSVSTSIEWAIVNYDATLNAFSKPGDSGSIIADIHGRIGGMLTGGSGNTLTSDVTYATPWWWLLGRIRDAKNGFPGAHVV